MGMDAKGVSDLVGAGIRLGVDSVGNLGKQ
jgi:hypothetical protein